MHAVMPHDTGPPGGMVRLRDDDDCDNLCEDVSELEAHTRLQESDRELSEHQFGDDYDDGMEYDADA